MMAQLILKTRDIPVIHGMACIDIVFAVCWYIKVNMSKALVVRILFVWLAIRTGIGMRWMMTRHDECTMVNTKNILVVTVVMAVIIAYLALYIMYGSEDKYIFRHSASSNKSCTNLIDIPVHQAINGHSASSNKWCTVQCSSNTNNALNSKSFKEASIDRNVQPNIQTCTSNKSVQSLKCNPNTNNRMNMQPIKPQSRPRKRSMKHNAK
eukprot:922373_1